MPKKVLVADDEVHIPRLVRSALVREGYDVVTATDGIEALHSIETDRPDLVLLDLAMPNMDGHETLRRLKSSPETCSIRVVIVSARDGDEDISRAWRAGADGYLIKPFTPSVLVSVVQAALGERPASEVSCWPRPPKP
jgi:CheY-like chemotaxis protein